MRLTIIFLNFLAVLFFGVFFAYTFVAKDHIKSLARSYAIVETVAYATPLVDLAQEKFEKNTVQLLTPTKQKKLIQSEFEKYRKNPKAYVSHLANKAEDSAAQSTVFTKLAPFRAKIKTHLDEKLNALLRDLRIFAGSNLVAGSIALLLSLRSPKKVRVLLVWLSFLMFLAVCFASYIYVDDFSFFNILHGHYMGWAYPVLLSYLILRFFWEGWRDHDVINKIDEAIN